MVIWIRLIRWILYKFIGEKMVLRRTKKRFYLINYETLKRAVY